MQSLHQSIICILSSFWTYKLLEFNENIEKLTCRESMRCRIPPKPYCSLQMSTAIRYFRRTVSYTVTMHRDKNIIFWKTSAFAKLDYQSKQTLVLIIITLFKNCKIQRQIYLLNHEVCQWLATGRWFSPGTLVSSTNQNWPPR